MDWLCGERTIRTRCATEGHRWQRIAATVCILAEWLFRFICIQQGEESKEGKLMMMMMMIHDDDDDDDDDDDTWFIKVDSTWEELIMLYIQRSGSWCDCDTAKSW